jgi:hypothetical protein
MTRRKHAMSSTALELELSRSDFKNYSETEKRLFRILRSLKGERINTEKLTVRFYGKDIPFNGRTIISGCVNALMRKVEWNKEPFRICRSERAGPNSTDVWLEPR